MLKVMLVEDEISVLEGLKVSIEWEKYGFNLVSTAQNGEEGLIQALENKPDLIITDITMPKMDGFEMIEKIREKLPEIKVIFLTCHEVFNFAKRAVNLDADEYLIKDTMTRQELYSSLDKIRKSIEDKIQNKERFEELSIEINRNRCHLSEILINELMKKEFINIDSFERRLNVYNYNFRKAKFILSLITIDHYTDLVKSDIFQNDTSLIRFVIMNIIEGILKKNEIGEVFPKSKNEYVIIYNYNLNLKYSITDRIHSVSKEIQTCINKAIKNTCTIYIGIQVDSLLEMNHAYEDLLILRNERFYLQDGMILIPSKKAFNLTSFNSHYVIGFIKEFEHCLGELDIGLLSELIDLFFEKIINEHIIASAVKDVIEITLISLISALERNGCMYKQVIHENYINMINSIDNVVDLKNIFCNYLVNAVEIIKKNAVFYSTPEVRKIIQYISIHLHEDISLDSIASYVKMNSSYFSRYFKSKTGVNFVDFLTSIRIDKAKELLLETEFSIDEISIRVGHVNKAYFTKVFKKVTGLNPGEFRKKLHA